MKRGIILVFLFFTLTLVIKSQNTIGLSYQDHVSNTINSFLTENIISDYGPRSCGPNCSPWHRGIDLNIPGELDHGNRILSPIAGTVTQIYIAGTYIVLVIKGIDDVNYG